MTHRSRPALIAAALICLSQPAAAAETDRLLLMWQRDPTTTMTVQCLEEVPALPVVEGSRAEPAAFDIPRIEGEPIDGKVDAWWEKGLAIEFLRDALGHAPAPQNLHVDLRAGWNSEGLLVAARIRDDRPLEAEKPEDFWQFDSIEIFLRESVAPQRRYQAVISSGSDPAYAEPRSKFYLHSREPERKAEDLTGHAAATGDAGIHTLELLLPWNNFPGLTAAEGTILGFQIYVNDRDGKEPAQRYVWYPSVNTHHEPSSNYPLRLATTVSPPSRASAVVVEEEGLAKVSGRAELAGGTARLLHGTTEIASGEMRATAGAAHATLHIPPAPKGQQWGILDLKIDDEFVSSVQTPEVHAKNTPPRQIRYWEASAGDTHALVAPMTVKPLRNWSGKFMHHVELANLSPGTAYRFRVDGTEELGFRTLPSDLTEPLRLAIGGDTRHRQEWMEKTNRAAMKYRPQAIIWGGDLAYDDGSKENTHMLQEWFDAIQDTLRDEEGYLVPIIVALGNHEVRGGYAKNHADYEQTDAGREKIAPYFFQLFPFPGHPGYNVLDAGNYLSLVVLDTGHTNPMAGAQTEWLARTLAARRDVRHVIPVYHIPAYPSVRKFEGASSEAVRNLWLPLFEQHGVRMAFENHDHAYKRTPPLRDGKVSPDGITYIGDGAWGVAVRDVRPAESTWYLERSAAVRHAIILTLHDTKAELLVVDEEGSVIDELSLAPGAPAP